jgi:hypothetical protein
MNRTGFSALLAVLFFAHCNGAGPIVISNKDIVDHERLRWENDSSTLVFSNNDSITSHAIGLQAGKYVLRFNAEATSVNNITPHVVVSLGRYLLKDMLLEKGKKEYQLKFELPEKTNAPVRFKFDNDYNDSTGDRNIFIDFPISINPY